MISIKHILLICFCAITVVVYGQNPPCGYKTTCECDNTISDFIDNSDLIFEGIVTAVDTIPLHNLITKKAFKNIQTDTQIYADCAKDIISRTDVLVVTIQPNKYHKGKKNNKKIQICTPIEPKLCGYQYFIVGEPYVVYSTIDTTADIYYTYTLDYEYFILKPDYRYWTNHCMQTKKIKSVEPAK